jgi:hypothetical protein
MPNQYALRLDIEQAKFELGDKSTSRRYSLVAVKSSKMELADVG